MAGMRRTMGAGWFVMSLVWQDPEQYKRTLAEAPPSFQDARWSRSLFAPDPAFRCAGPAGVLREIVLGNAHGAVFTWMPIISHRSASRKSPRCWPASTTGRKVERCWRLTGPLDGTEHIVGVARLARPEGKPDSPLVESAVVVRDDFQGQGVGTELLARLVLLAKQMGARTLLAEFQPHNQAAIRLFRELNLPTEISASHGETSMRITLPAA